MVLLAVLGLWLILAKGQIQKVMPSAVIVAMATTNPLLRTRARPEHKRHEFIQNIIDHACDVLKKNGFQEDCSLRVAISVADRIIDVFGGQVINFPVDYARKIRIRDEQIYTEFTGDNFGELAAKYGMLEVSVRRVIARVKARNKADGRTNSLAESKQ